MKKNKLALVLLMALFEFKISMAQTIIYAQNFDSSGTFPQNMYRQTFNSAPNWGLDTTSRYSGKYAAKVNYQNSNSMLSSWLTTPSINIPSNGSTVLSFFEKKRFTGISVQKFRIKISSGSQTDTLSLDLLKEYTEDSLSQSFKKRTIDLSAYKGKTVYISFISVQRDGNDWWLDDIEVTTNGTVLSIPLTSKSVFSLYPNPAKEVINIAGLNSEGGKIEIWSTNGLKISEYNLSPDNFQVPIMHLNSGIYFIKIESKKTSASYKFLKEN
jgi:hypothetical protein